MTLYKWSQTPASNATADSTINWAEGQAPSSVNDSARAMMTAVSKYRDDISGAIATGGTSTAYTVTSYEVFDTLAHMANQMIAFTPHTTNAATVTLNVDGLGAKPLRSAPSTELLAGVLIQGTPYVAVYNNSDAAWYLQGFYGNPYNTPLGGSLQYWANSTPNSSFALMYGQAISRTTYAGLFSMFGTAYGAGDSSTTFNIPDLRGRVPAGVDSMGGSAASRLTSSYFGAAASLGAVGGGESQTLTAGQIPSITSSAVNAITVGSSRADIVVGGVVASNNGSNAAINTLAGGSTVTAFNSTGNNTISVTSNNTGGNPHTIVQPTICCNYILRII